MPDYSYNSTNSSLSCATEEGSYTVNQQPNVSIDCFEGPLELLLFLIKAQEVDIWEVSLAAVCDQYIAILSRSKDMDIEIGGDFLSVASTLLEIKSKRILPVENSEQVEELDPREELIAQVLAYRDSKKHAESLRELERESARYFQRGYFEGVRITKKDHRRYDAWTLFKAYQKLLAQTYARLPRVIKVAEYPTEFYRKRISTSLFGKKSITFSSIFSTSSDRTEIVSTFLALLDMIKDGAIIFYQGERFGEIRISWNEPPNKANDFSGTSTDTV